MTSRHPRLEPCLIHAVRSSRASVLLCWRGRPQWASLLIVLVRTTRQQDRLAGLVVLIVHRMTQFRAGTWGRSPAVGPSTHSRRRPFSSARRFCKRCAARTNACSQGNHNIGRCALHPCPFYCCRLYGSRRRTNRNIYRGTMESTVSTLRLSRQAHL